MARSSSGVLARSEPQPWTALPAVFLPATAAVYGSLVELDNTDNASNDAKGGSPPPKTRVAVDADDGALDQTEHAETTKPARRRA